MVFFNALAQLIRPILQKKDGQRVYFNKVDKLDVQAVFNKYFKRDELIEDIYEGTEFEKFAIKLIDSGAF